jgi:hypothetical protein
MITKSLAFVHRLVLTEKHNIGLPATGYVPVHRRKAEDASE